MIEERGLAPATGKEYCRKAAVFVEGVGGPGALPGLAAADVAGYVVGYSAAHCWESCRTMLRAVRAFLRYGHVAGLCPDLVDAVPSVARRRDTAPRRGVGAELVGTLVSQTKSNRTARDSAVVALVARLGLRAVAVSRLEVGDIDWAGGTVRINGKGSRVEKMPLPADVGEALVAYLLVRPAGTGHARMFLALAGAQPLTPPGICHIVRSACRAAGIDEFGPHTLRHSLGTRLLNEGAGLDQIAQVLRHKSMASTVVYAKADMVSLTAVARPWPGAGK
ncbi:MAG: tyrosine-type recombinase/integrase [Bifidobacteriaceae bacterium]|nr:tyrosine-type recombinase/integrase [Bifidobacteriaceae bacterium]